MASASAQPPTAEVVQDSTGEPSRGPARRERFSSLSPPLLPSAPLSTVSDALAMPQADDHVTPEGSSHSHERHCSSGSALDAFPCATIRAEACVDDDSTGRRAKVLSREDVRADVKTSSGPSASANFEPVFEVDAGTLIRWTCHGTAATTTVLRASDLCPEKLSAASERAGAAESNANERCAGPDYASGVRDSGLTLVIIPDDAVVPVIMRKIPSSCSYWEETLDRIGSYTYYVCSGPSAYGRILAKKPSTHHVSAKSDMFCYQGTSVDVQSDHKQHTKGRIQRNTPPRSKLTDSGGPLPPRIGSASASAATAEGPAACRGLDSHGKFGARGRGEGHGLESHDTSITAALESALTKGVRKPVSIKPSPCPAEITRLEDAGYNSSRRHDGIDEHHGHTTPRAHPDRIDIRRPSSSVGATPGTSPIACFPGGAGPPPCSSGPAKKSSPGVTIACADFPSSIGDMRAVQAQAAPNSSRRAIRRNSEGDIGTISSQQSRTSDLEHRTIESCQRPLESTGTDSDGCDDRHTAPAMCDHELRTIQAGSDVLDLTFREPDKVFTSADISPESGAHASVKEVMSATRSARADQEQAIGLLPSSRRGLACGRDPQTPADVGQPVGASNSDKVEHLESYGPATIVASSMEKETKQEDEPEGYEHDVAAALEGAAENPVVFALEKTLSTSTGDPGLTNADSCADPKTVEVTIQSTTADHATHESTSLALGAEAQCLSGTQASDISSSIERGERPMTTSSFSDRATAPPFSSKEVAYGGLQQCDDECQLGAATALPTRYTGVQNYLPPNERLPGQACASVEKTEANVCEWSLQSAERSDKTQDVEEMNNLVGPSNVAPASTAASLLPKTPSPEPTNAPASKPPELEQGVHERKDVLARFQGCDGQDEDTNTSPIGPAAGDGLRSPPREGPHRRRVPTVDLSSSGTYGSVTCGAFRGEHMPTEDEKHFSAETGSYFASGRRDTAWSSSDGAARELLGGAATSQPTNCTIKRRDKDKARGSLSLGHGTITPTEATEALSEELVPGRELSSQDEKIAQAPTGVARDEALSSATRKNSCQERGTGESCSKSPRRDRGGMVEAAAAPPSSLSTLAAVHQPVDGISLPTAPVEKRGAIGDTGVRAVQERKDDNTCQLNVPALDLLLEADDNDVPRQSERLGRTTTAGVSEAAHRVAISTTRSAASEGSRELKSSFLQDARQAISNDARTSVVAETTASGMLRERNERDKARKLYISSGSDADESTTTQTSPSAPLRSESVGDSSFPPLSKACTAQSPGAEPDRDVESGAATPSDSAKAAEQRMQPPLISPRRGPKGSPERIEVSLPLNSGALAGGEPSSFDSDDIPCDDWGRVVDTPPGIRPSGRRNTLSSSCTSNRFPPTVLALSVPDELDAGEASGETDRTLAQSALSPSLGRGRSVRCRKVEILQRDESWQEWQEVSPLTSPLVPKGQQDNTFSCSRMANRCDEAADRNGEEQERRTPMVSPAKCQPRDGASERCFSPTPSKAAENREAAAKSALSASRSANRSKSDFEAQDMTSSSVSPTETKRNESCVDASPDTFAQDPDASPPVAYRTRNCERQALSTTDRCSSLKDQLDTCEGQSALMESSASFHAEVHNQGKDNRSVSATMSSRSDGESESSKEHVVIVQATPTRTFDPDMLTITPGASVSWTRESTIRENPSPDMYSLRLGCPIVAPGWQTVLNFSLSSSQPTFRHTFERDGRFVVSRSALGGLEEAQGVVLVKGEASDSASHSFASSDDAHPHSEPCDVRSEGCRSDVGEMIVIAVSDDSFSTTSSSTAESKASPTSVASDMRGPNGEDSCRDILTRVESRRRFREMCAVETSSDSDVPFSALGVTNFTDSEALGARGLYPGVPPLLRPRSLPPLVGGRTMNDDGGRTAPDWPQRSLVPETKRSLAEVPSPLSSRDSGQTCGASSTCAAIVGSSASTRAFDDGNGSPSEEPSCVGKSGDFARSVRPPSPRPHRVDADVQSGDLLPNPNCQQNIDDAEDTFKGLGAQVSPRGAQEGPDIIDAGPEDYRTVYADPHALPQPPRNKKKQAKKKRRKAESTGAGAGRGGNESGATDETGVSMSDSRRREGQSVPVTLRKMEAGVQSTSKSERKAAAKTIIVGDKGIMPARNVFVEVESVLVVKTASVWSTGGYGQPRGRSICVAGRLLPHDTTSPSPDKIKKEYTPNKYTHVVSPTSPVEAVFLEVGDYWLTDVLSAKRIKVTATPREFTEVPLVRSGGSTDEIDTSPLTEVTKGSQKAGGHQKGQGLPRSKKKKKEKVKPSSGQGVGTTNRAAVVAFGEVTRTLDVTSSVTSPTAGEAAAFRGAEAAPADGSDDHEATSRHGQSVDVLVASPANNPGGEEASSAHGLSSHIWAEGEGDERATITVAETSPAVSQPSTVENTGSPPDQGHQSSSEQGALHEGKEQANGERSSIRGVQAPEQAAPEGSCTGESRGEKDGADTEAMPTPPLETLRSASERQHNGSGSRVESPAAMLAPVVKIMAPTTCSLTRETSPRREPGVLDEGGFIQQRSHVRRLKRQKSRNERAEAAQAANAAAATSSAAEMPEERARPRASRVEPIEDEIASEKVKRVQALMSSLAARTSGSGKAVVSVVGETTNSRITSVGVPTAMAKKMSASVPPDAGEEASVRQGSEAETAAARACAYKQRPAAPTATVVYPTTTANRDHTQPAAMLEQPSPARQAQVEGFARNRRISQTPIPPSSTLRTACGTSRQHLVTLAREYGEQRAEGAGVNRRSHVRAEWAADVRVIIGREDWANPYEASTPHETVCRSIKYRGGYSTELGPGSEVLDVSRGPRLTRPRSALSGASPRRGARATSTMTRPRVSPPPLPPPQHHDQQQHPQHHHRKRHTHGWESNFTANTMGPARVVWAATSPTMYSGNNVQQCPGLSHIDGNDWQDDHVGRGDSYWPGTPLVQQVGSPEGIVTSAIPGAMMMGGLYDAAQVAGQPSRDSSEASDHAATSFAPVVMLEPALVTTPVPGILDSEGVSGPGSGKANVLHTNGRHGAGRDDRRSAPVMITTPTAKATSAVKEGSPSSSSTAVVATTDSSASTFGCDDCGFDINVRPSELNVFPTGRGARRSKSTSSSEAIISFGDFVPRASGTARLAVNVASRRPSASPGRSDPATKGRGRVMTRGRPSSSPAPCEFDAAGSEAAHEGRSTTSPKSQRSSGTDKSKNESGSTSANKIALPSEVHTKAATMCAGKGQHPLPCVSRSQSPAKDSFGEKGQPGTDVKAGSELKGAPLVVLGGDAATWHTSSAPKNDAARGRSVRWGNCSTRISHRERLRRSRDTVNTHLPPRRSQDVRIKARPAPFPEAGRSSGDGLYSREDPDDVLPPPSAYERQETTRMMQLYEAMMERLRTTGFDAALPNGHKPMIYDLT